MTNNITKAQKNEAIIAMLKGESAIPYGVSLQMAIEHLEHENELIAKKSASSKEKRNENKAEQNELKECILATLEGNPDGMTATEVMVMCSLKSSQMATHLLRELVESGSVMREVVKGKSYYKLVA